MPAGLQPHLVLERAIELDARHHHLGQRERAPELPDETCRVKRRAARQFRPLDEDDIVPAEPREPVERSRSRRRHLRSPPPGRAHAPRHHRSATRRAPDSPAVRARMSQIAPDSFGHGLDRQVPDLHRVPLRRARGAGRTKPPEEHYAEAEGSSGRWTKAFPARRISAGRALRARPCFSSSLSTRASAFMRSFTLCEKKTSQFATSPSRSSLDGATGAA